MLVHWVTVQTYEGLLRETTAGVSWRLQGPEVETLICLNRDPVDEHLKEGAWEFVETLSSSMNMLSRRDHPMLLLALQSQNRM